LYPFFIDENVLTSYMTWFQKEIILSPHERGFQIITHIIKNELEELQNIKVGKAHIFY